jgi:hypothetical protein
MVTFRTKWLRPSTLVILYSLLQNGSCLVFRIFSFIFISPIFVILYFSPSSQQLAPVFLPLPGFLPSPPDSLPTYLVPTHSDVSANTPPPPPSPAVVQSSPASLPRRPTRTRSTSSSAPSGAGHPHPPAAGVLPGRSEGAPTLSLPPRHATLSPPPAPLRRWRGAPCKPTPGGYSLAEHGPLLPLPVLSLLPRRPPCLPHRRAGGGVASSLGGGRDR